MILFSWEWLTGAAGRAWVLEGKKKGARYGREGGNTSSAQERLNSRYFQPPSKILGSCSLWQEKSDIKLNKPARE